MGNESSIYVSSKELVGVEIQTSEKSAPISLNFPSSEFASSSLTDFPSLDLILAQPLVIGKKRLQHSSPETDDESADCLESDVCYKRVCISL